MGYIIGPKIAGVLLAGGVFSWLVLMPAIHFFGAALTHPMYPGTKLIAQMGPRRAVDHLHPADWRGRGGGRGADHAA